VTDLTLDLARWWPLLLWPAAAWLTWWSLRVTRPEPSRRLRRGLALARLALWTVLILLLCGPRLRWNEVQRRPATLAVLLDNSASLRHLVGRLDHGDWLPQLASRLDGVRLRLFAYDGGLRELSATEAPLLPGDGVETDLDGALAGVERAMQGEHWTGLLLVGDGNPTTGAWPLERVRRLPARVWCAGTGRLDPVADLVLREVELNRQARLGRAQPISVDLESRGLGGRTARVTLSEEGRQLAVASLELGVDGARQRVELEWTPQVAGPRLLRLDAVLEGGGERTAENNGRAVQVRVEEARRPILLLAGRPSEDLGFLRSVLEARPDLDLLFAMPERPGVDLADLRRAIERSRLLVLAHWPLRGRSPELAALVAGALPGKPLLWLDGEGADLERLAPALERGLGPWRPGAAGGVRVPQAHALLGPEESLAELRAIYAEMPPLAATRGLAGGAPPAGGRVLLESAEGRPLLLLRQQAELRQAWLTVQGLGRWGVGSQLSLGGNRRARDLVDGLADWLLAAPVQGLLRVRPDREALPAGAPLAFEARLREEDGRPRDGASIELRLLGPDSLARGLSLEPRGGGAYAGTLPALPPGEWRWLALARLGDRPQLADSGRVLVEERSPESLDGSRNQRLLGEMAALGGGRLFNLDDAEDRARLASGEALDSLETRPLLRRAGRQRELAGEGWILAALLLLIAGEWIWRRVNGLL
jgi:hypothetical protein